MNQADLFAKEPIAIGTDPFGHWLAGFVDGEGCFYFSVTSDGSCRPVFRLKVRLDDKDVLNRARDWSGVGVVVEIHNEKLPNPQCEWIVRKKRHVLKLVEIFTAYPLRAKKAKDFEIWAKAVNVWIDIRAISAGYHRGTIRDPRQKTLLLLRSELKECRRYK